MEITAETLSKNTKEYQIYDIRGEVDRLYGIIPDSAAATEESILSCPPEDKQKPIVIVCARGQISLDIAEKLCGMGYAAYSLRGGYAAWLREEVKKQSTENEAYALRKKVEESIQKKFHSALMSPFTKALKDYELVKDGERLIDLVLTTQELVRMIKEAGIDFANLPDTEPDDPFAEYTGAGVIFGATGGVTEAVLRRVSDDKSINAIRSIGNCGVRGTEGVKEFTVPFNGGELRIAVVSGLGNAEKLIKQLLAKEVSFDFVEVMACPGGCVNGGGQPVTIENAKKVRADGLYSADMTNTLKTSDTNPLMDKLYADYVKGRNHEMLHVHYKHN